MIEVDITIHARGSIETPNDLLVCLANMCGLSATFAEYELANMTAEDVTFEHYVCVNVIFFLQAPKTCAFQALQKQPLVLAYHAYDTVYVSLKALHQLTKKEACIRAGMSENADDIPKGLARDVWNVFYANFTKLVSIAP